MWEEILKSRFDAFLSEELIKAGMPVKLLREILDGLSLKELKHYGRMVKVMKPELIKKIVDLWVKYRVLIGDKLRGDGASNTVYEEDFNKASPEEIVPLRKYLLHLLETKNL